IEPYQLSRQALPNHQALPILRSRYENQTTPLKISATVFATACNWAGIYSGYHCSFSGGKVLRCYYILQTLSPISTTCSSRSYRNGPKNAKLGDKYSQMRNLT
ncbi:MAG: hypothetical protein WBW48_05090, partial [Anaerolineae bacterium]